jgi:ABC-type sugar transport system ATPase subunit
LQVVGSVAAELGSVNAVAGIRFEHLTKEYMNGVLAVDDLDLEVGDGEFLVLVGPSGCGKSSILRLVAGLEHVTSGKVWIGNDDVTTWAPRQRDIAMVFQSYALYPTKTVYENLAFGLRMHRAESSEIDRRVNEAASLLGLSPSLLRARPRELSGGERQRVALGRAIVRHPKVFLLDEPLSNLDAKLRNQTRVEIQQLHRRLGTTFIYVTHDQIEAMTMGHRIVVMNRGHVQQVGTPKDVYERPANTFVGGFIGSPGMNMVTAEVRGRVASASGFSLVLPLDVGQERVVLGVRPEHIEIGEGSSPGTAFDVRVELVESMGARQYAYGKCGEDRLILELPRGMDTDGGSVMKVRVGLRDVHMFDAESGCRLSLDGLANGEVSARHGEANAG